MRNRLFSAVLFQKCTQFWVFKFKKWYIGRCKCQGQIQIKLRKLPLVFECSINKQLFLFRIFLIFDCFDMLLCCKMLLNLKFCIAGDIDYAGNAIQFYTISCQ